MNISLAQNYICPTFPPILKITLQNKNPYIDCFKLQNISFLQIKCYYVKYCLNYSKVESKILYRLLLKNNKYY